MNCLNGISITTYVEKKMHMDTEAICLCRLIIFPSLNDGYSLIVFTAHPFSLLEIEPGEMAPTWRWQRRRRADNSGALTEPISQRRQGQNMP